MSLHRTSSYQNGSLCSGRSADIFFFSSSFSQKDKNSKQKDSKQPPVLSCWRKKAKLLYNILLSCHKMLLLMHKVGLNAMHIRVRLRFSVRVGYEIKPFKSFKNKSWFRSLIFFKEKKIGKIPMTFNTEK